MCIIKNKSPTTMSDNKRIESWIIHRSYARNPVNYGNMNVYLLSYRYDKLKPFGFGIHGCIDG